MYCSFEGCQKIGIIYDAHTYSLYCCMKCQEEDSKEKICKSSIRRIIDFQKDMRQVWSDHVFYTRNYIISTINDLPDTEFTLNRLLRNQEDIGRLIGGVYYNEKVRQAITNLLKEHIAGAGAIITEAKNNGSDNIESLKEAWYENAHQISIALYFLNKENWSIETLEELMKKHLDDTLNEAVHYLKGEFEESIKDYDMIYRHILHMSDVLSRGIIKQFPKKFQVCK